MEGDLVDCGTGRGGTSIFLAAYLAGHELFGRRAVGRRPVRRRRRARRGRAGVVRARPEHRAGRASSASACSTTGSASSRARPARLWRRRRSTTSRCCGSTARSRRRCPRSSDAVYDKVRPGGFVIIDDYGSEACARGGRGVPLRARHRTASSSGSTGAPPTGARPRARRPRPIAPPASRRHARPVAVGSGRLPQHAARGRADVALALALLPARHRGPRLRGHRDRERLDPPTAGSARTSSGASARSSTTSTSASESSPSPANALNRGLELARGRAVAVMIDGAHVLTPGVLHFGMLGLSTYAPAVVSTQQWYVGPGEQNEAVSKGYDEGLRGPALRARSSGPSTATSSSTSGTSSVAATGSTGSGRATASSCRARCSTRSERWTTTSTLPGGGFANLDFFERMTTSPRIKLVTILGEGSFHQVHGGTTTNAPESTERQDLLESYGDQYAEIRGRVFKSPAKVVHYVGALPDSARRTKARRMGAPVYFKLAHVEGTDGRPADPIPVPDELRTSFIDAFWRSKEWQQTPWLGRWTGQAAHRPDGLSGAHRARAAGLDHRDRHRRRRARLLPGHDLRPARPWPRARRSTTTRCRSSSSIRRIEYRARATRPTRRPRPRCASWSGSNRACAADSRSRQDVAI